MLIPQKHTNLILAVAAAKLCEQQTECPAELTVAQWALESGWGTEMPAGSNNPFGIKALAGQPSIDKMTTEYVHGEPVQIMQKFRAYPHLADAFADHARLITQGAPYVEAWAAYRMNKAYGTNGPSPLIKLIKGVKNQDGTWLYKGIAAVYSTSPIYADQLLEILDMPEVKAALA